METFIHLLDLIGVCAFAATGAMLASKHGFDVFGGLVLAFVTGIGGGTMRDIILNVPVFWLAQPSEIYACFAGFGVVYLYLRKYHDTPKATINLVDLLGLALFTILGAQKTLDMGLSALDAVIMGLLTGCGGGLIRDVLANEVPMIMVRKKLYATASLAGALVFVALNPASTLLAIILGAVTVIAVRLGSLFRDWRLPLFPK